MNQKFFSKPFFEVWLNQAHPKIKEWFQKEIAFNSKILLFKFNLSNNSLSCGFENCSEIKPSSV